MEVYSLQIDTHVWDLSHSVVNLVIGFKIITEFSWKRCRNFVSSVFLDCDSPQYPNIGGIGLYFDELINGVCCGKVNSDLFRPNQVLFVFDRIRVHDAFETDTCKQGLFYLYFWCAIHTCALAGQILDQVHGRAWLDCIVGLNPGQGTLPGTHLVECFSWVVN